MEHSTIAESGAARRRVMRPAYKGTAARWRLIALICFTAWIFTTGWLVYTLRHTDIVKVLMPTAYEGRK